MKSIAWFIMGMVPKAGTGSHRKEIVLLFAMSAILLLSGCATMGESAGLGTADKTAQLKPGMKYEQVEALLGKPESSKTVKRQQIVRWNLHEYWKGWVPYDMVFDARKKTLVSWSANEKEFQASQRNGRVCLAHPEVPPVQQKLRVHRAPPRLLALRMQVS